MGVPYIGSGRASALQGAARARSQRGFSLIIVFLIMMVMAVIALTVMISTQGDLQVSAHEREAAVAFYAAEAGVAMAIDYLNDSGVTGDWSPLLALGQPNLCPPAVPPDLRKPGVGPPPGPAQVFDLPRSGTYRFCIHNDSLDNNYVDLDPLRPGDETDSNGLVTIESYGYGPNGAESWITVERKVPVKASRIRSYHQAGGGPAGRNLQKGESVVGGGGANRI